MNIVICDDNNNEVKKLIDLSQRYIKEKHLIGEITGVTSPDEIEKTLPDVLILDVEMPDKTGIEIKDSMAGREKPYIIFATAYPEKMCEAFGTNVIGFLVKPVEWEHFEKTMDLAVNLSTLNRPISFEDGSKGRSCDIRTIVFEGKYTEALLANGDKKRWLRKSLTAWEEELKNFGFIRVNKSTIINCKHIKRFEGDNVILDDLSVFRMSRRKKNTCIKEFREYSRRYGKYL